MFNPYSGKRLSNLIFIGPIFYQRLRHLVDDKMYARARGTVVALTRQPTHGRSRGGGLRFGEMERDCILSHGISKFLQERLFKVSDLFRIHVCSRCGLMADVNLELNSLICRYCISKGVSVGLFRKRRTPRSTRWRSPTRPSSSCRNSWPCTSSPKCVSTPALPTYDIPSYLSVTPIILSLSPSQSLR